MKKFLLIPLIMLVFVSGCTSQTFIEGEEKDQWFQIATPMAENILQSLNDNDYEGYTSDFSETMRNAMPEEKFNEIRDLISSKIGNYVSFEPSTVFEAGEFVSVNFAAEFEEEKGVTLRIVFRRGDEEYKIEGLWTDSLKLRG